jgi:hypothetical protein
MLETHRNGAKMREGGLGLLSGLRAAADAGRTSTVNRMRANSVYLVAKAG